VTITWHVPDALPCVHLDRLKLKEIVQNLVSNALKFTRRGSVTVVAGAAGGALRIDVRDTGPGIPHEAQGRIFEMFERVEADGEECRPGVGLGLYSARSLVVLMGGRIAFESEPGSGSCFTVHLPLADAASPTSPAGTLDRGAA